MLTASQLVTGSSLCPHPSTTRLLSESREHTSPRRPELVAPFVQIQPKEIKDHTTRARYMDFVDTFAAGFSRDVFLDQGGFDSMLPRAWRSDLAVAVASPALLFGRALAFGTGFILGLLANPGSRHGAGDSNHA